MLTDLNLANTFLDIAASTADRSHALQCINSATTALRTVDKFLSELPPGIVNAEEIQTRREQLAERLRTVSELDGSG